MQAAIDEKKDDVLLHFEKDMDDRKEQMIKKLGDNLSPEEQQLIME